MNDAPQALKAALSDRYAIDREVGAGGMATVYLATDLRHHRKVALKVLRPELAAVLGPERFLSEIQVTANLQHPHLLPLFDSGEAEGLLFYVMPFVEGESLRQKLERERQLPVEEAVRIAAAVASALDYAHRHGVVHRDLKPENVLLHEGQPLVADFGIALAVSNAGGARITQTGLSLGTPSYMSPEQATGDRVVDARSDQYSLAALTYEMLVGDPPHVASTSQAVIAKLLTERPRSVRVARPSVPEHVDLALQKALEKLPADRFASAGEFGEAITGVRPVSAPAGATRALRPDEQDTSPLTARRRLLRALVPWGTAAAAVLVASATLWASRGSEGAAAPVVRFTVTLPPGDALPNQGGGAAGATLALSSDGRTLVYAAVHEGVTQLYRRSVDQLEAVAIPGTEGGNNPFLSPDGQWVGFLAAGQKLKKVPLAGGAGATIGEAGNPFSGAVWGPDDRIVFSGGVPSVLRVVSAAGGAPQPLTTLDAGEIGHRWPSLLPGGAGVLFTVVKQDGVSAAVTLEAGGHRTLLEDAMPVAGAPTGDLLFYRGGSLWAVPFDARRGSLGGDPLPVVQDVASQGTGGVATLGGTLVGGGGFAAAAISSAGTLAYRAGGTAVQGTRTLVWVDREGREEPIAAPPRAYVYPRISPDGSRVALDARDQESDLWIWDFARATLTRLTFSPGPDIAPAWSPDGRRVAYQAARDSTQDVFWRPADGTGAEERLTTTSTSNSPTSFFPDGKGLVIRNVVDGAEALSALSLEGDRTIQPLVHSTFTTRNGEVSPDGRWLAYQSDESGRAEVYVRPLPNPDAGRWQISTGGGTRPLWSRDGRELFYLSPDGRIMDARVEPGAAFAAGTPQPLPIRGRYYSTSPQAVALRTYDVSPDGKRFLLIKDAAAAGEAPVTQFTVVVNWFAELKRLTVAKR